MVNRSDRLAPMEFITACCRRDTIRNPLILKANLTNNAQEERQFICRCDGVDKDVDPFGYHMVGCKKEANAIRLHDNVVNTLVVLLRTLGS